MQQKFAKILIVGAVCTLLAGCGPALQFEKKDYRGVYRNDKLAVGFHLDDWEIREGIPGSVVVCRSPLESATDRFRENFVINIASKVTTAEELQSALGELEKQMPKFQVIDKKAEGPLVYVTFTYRASKEDGGETVEARTYFIAGEKSPLSVTFTSTAKDFERWLPKFEAILAQIKTREAELPEVPSPTPSATPGSSGTPTASGTPAASATPTASGTPAASATPTASGTPAASATPTASGTPAASATPAASGTPAASATPTASGTPAHPSASATP